VKLRQAEPDRRPAARRSLSMFAKSRRLVAAKEVFEADPVSHRFVRLGPTDVYWIARTGSAYEVRRLPK
jgi:hypothetical protein